jgi:hypothetical protein
MIGAPSYFAFARRSKVEREKIVSFLTEEVLARD